MKVRVIPGPGAQQRENVGRVLEVESEHMTQNGLHWYFCWTNPHRGPIMSNIKINLTKMFAYHNPWDCSNSVANMGADTGKITWKNAMHVARDVTEWLPDADANEPIACEAIRDWAKSTGAWDEEEREGWTETECLALLVQNVASDLMSAGFEGEPDCAEDLAAFAEHEASYIMHMEIVDGEVFANLYFGG